MAVTALLFFLGAAAAALIYHRLPNKWRNLWLVLISVGFLITWSWQFVIVLTFFTWINFTISKKIDPLSPSRKKWVAGGIVFNVLFLVVLKYNQFYLPALISCLKSMGVLHSSPALQILLPVGLSFLMVQAISYLLDVSNNRLKPELDFIKFGVYVLYFPKVLSGPVEKARTFLTRLESPLPVDRVLIERSLALILTGLFRKLVFANPLFNLIPPDALINPQSFAGQDLFFWLLAYAFAIYNDFAGYTGIIRGVSLWFGIVLTNNFNLPYFSRNFTEFWNRWHISLSNWLRDYIFFPLSRSVMKRFPERNHFFNLVIPPMVTLLVSGMWHGLSWNLLVWGALHGLFLILERIPGLWRANIPLDERPRWRQHLGLIITFTFTALAWLPFRMTIPISLKYLEGIFHWSLPRIDMIQQALAARQLPSNWSGFNLPNPILILLLAGAIGLDLLQNRSKREDFLLFWPRFWQMLFILVLLGISLLAFFSDSAAPFVYQGF